MNLNALPDLVLRTIFSLLTLVDLIHRIPLVCHRWRALQPSVLAQKRTLILMIGENDVDSNLISYLDCDVTLPHTDLLVNEDGTLMYQDYQMECARLDLRGLTCEDVDRFIETFPAVTYLDLSVCSQPVVETMPLVTRLLGHWAPWLETLKFRCHFDTTRYGISQASDIPRKEAQEKLQAQVMPQLLPLINHSMPSLRHLTLYIWDNLNLNQQIDLPILAQLTEFHFNSPANFEAPNVYLFDSLKRYGESNGQLRAIGMGGNSRNCTTYVEYMKHLNTRHWRVVSLPWWVISIPELWHY